MIVNPTRFSPNSDRGKGSDHCNNIIRRERRRFDGFCNKKKKKEKEEKEMYININVYDVVAIDLLEWRLEYSRGGEFSCQHETIIVERS